jgi:hypothetical protein
MNVPDTSVTLAETLKSLEGIDQLTIAISTPADLAWRLDLLYRITSTIRVLQDEIVETLAASMEEDQMLIAGLGNLVRKQKFSSSWINEDSRERMFDDAMHAITAQIGVDPMTGEVHPALSRAIRETYRLLDACFSFSADPKAGFRKTLNLRTDDYRAKRQTGFSIAIEEVTL